MSGIHDLGYKEVYGHPVAVRDLLAGFTGLSCFKGLDVSAYERVNASYVSEKLRPRMAVQIHGTLLAWLRKDEQSSLRRGIDAWIKRLQLRETGLVFVEGVEQLLEENVMGESDEPRLGRWAEYFKGEGLEEGKMMALREMLKRQVRHRFGSIPEPMTAIVDQADVQTLERWIDRVLDASDAEGVFSD